MSDQPQASHGKAPASLRDVYRDSLTPEGGWVDKDGVVPEISKVASKAVELRPTCKACGLPIERVNNPPKPRQFCDRDCANRYRTRQRKALLTRETERSRKAREPA